MNGNRGRLKNILAVAYNTNNNRYNINAST